MRKNTGFTIIELALVVAILSILALIAIPNYLKAKSKTEQREAIANLQLIAAEEKIYYIDNHDYMDCNCTNATSCAEATGCNTLLRLMLNTQNWSYEVAVSGGAGARVATITATAKSGACVYNLTSTDFNSKNFSASSGCIN
ncbi:MAG: prepilin-type N-terminal cleavage/methylation domain-containing protein [Candidatus Omnitrophica bacterium]|nr:prepilin-type N-terminal cleavage/methylation domain-containing protein [Candidatus Omnitrophota bacterium]